MRINVYAEELLTDRCVELVSKKVKETGRVYYGVRLYLNSPDSLHFDEDDDDRTAITIWGDPKVVLPIIDAMRVEMTMVDDGRHGEREEPAQICVDDRHWIDGIRYAVVSKSEDDNRFVLQRVS